jgi:hypothetical protein
MPEELDVDAMIARFRDRADAVRRRGIPPVEGDERKRIMSQMRLDFQDFAMLGDASGSLDDGILTLRVDLRPAAKVPTAQSGAAQATDSGGAQATDSGGAPTPASENGPATDSGAAPAAENGPGSPSTT